MKFSLSWPIIGNNHITEYLSRLIQQKDLDGTYIFTGPCDLGKTTLAYYFAQSVLCDNYRKGQGTLPCCLCESCRKINLTKKYIKQTDSLEQSLHGDFHIVRKAKDKKNISISQIRELINTLGMGSFLNSYKIGIIKYAEDLSEEAANAFLKTLEEPKRRVIIILITNHIEYLPKTVVSRSRVLNFQLVNPDVIYDYLIQKYNITRSKAKNYSHLSLGRPALAVKFLENQNFYDDYFVKADILFSIIKRDTNESLKKIEQIFNNKVVGQENVAKAIEVVRIWQGIARDLLLFKLKQRRLIQHEMAITELKQAELNINIRDLLKLLSSLDKAIEYLKANVSPRIALESVVLAI